MLLFLGKQRRERENDMQQRATGGIEPVATAVRTKPLYMRCLLYQLSYQSNPQLLILTLNVMC